MNPEDKQAAVLQTLDPTQRQAILSLLQTLDTFAATTPVPRAWHAQWQNVFSQVAGRVQAAPPANPGNNGQEATT